MGKSNDSALLSELYIILLAVASAALVVAIYHCISVFRWNQQRQRQLQRQAAGASGSLYINEETPSSMDNSMVGLIPAHKHRKNMGLEGEDGTCPVCLSEFEEGDELRTLPECLHTYHAPCIDMWLYSHPNCPMCRTDATPSPSPRIQIIHIPDSVGEPTDHPLTQS